MNRKQALVLYRTHKGNAERVGKVFNLTFEQWLSIWLESGHFEERGHRRGQYVMARLGDCGPYEVGNVKIILHEDNCAEMYVNNPTRRQQQADIMRRVGKANRGHVPTQTQREAARQNGKANAGRLRPDLAEFNRSRVGQARDPLSVEKSRQAQIGRKRSPETKAKISAAIKLARSTKYWRSR